MTEPQDDTPALAETDPRKLIRIARAGEDAHATTAPAPINHARRDTEEGGRMSFS